MPQRRILEYRTAADLIEDVETIRRDRCDKCGQWSLAQACWHLDKAMSYAMEGHKSPNTPEQDAMSARAEIVLTTGQLPSGIKGPERAMPPANVPEKAIDDFLVTVRKFEQFKGPFSTHRVFGNLTDDEMRRLALIHAAHHLSHFVPSGKAG